MKHMAPCGSRWDYMVRPCWNLAFCLVCLGSSNLPVFWIWFKELRVDKFWQNRKVKGRKAVEECVCAWRQRRLCVCERVCVCPRVVSVKPKSFRGV